MKSAEMKAVNALLRINELLKGADISDKKTQNE
jgi:hypothetical protein